MFECSEQEPREPEVPVPEPARSEEPDDGDDWPDNWPDDWPGDRPDEGDEERANEHLLGDDDR